MTLMVSHSDRPPLSHDIAIGSAFDNSEGELTEAQDIAQEAFCRAWQRWSRVSSYDNPAA